MIFLKVLAVVLGLAFLLFGYFIYFTHIVDVEKLEIIIKNSEKQTF